MTAVRVTCCNCDRDLTLPAEQVRLICAAGVTTYAFLCTLCGAHVVRRASGPVLAALAARWRQAATGGALRAGDRRQAPVRPADHGRRSDSDRPRALRGPAVIERADESDGAVDELHTAVQAFSNRLADGDAQAVAMVSHSLVVWEETSYGEDGVQRATLYAATGDGSTPAGALGLALNLLRTLERDIVGCRCGD